MYTLNSNERNEQLHKASNRRQNINGKKLESKGEKQTGSIIIIWVFSVFVQIWL